VLRWSSNGSDFPFSDPTPVSVFLEFHLPPDNGMTEQVSTQLHGNHHMTKTLAIELAAICDV